MNYTIENFIDDFPAYAPIKKEEWVCIEVDYDYPNDYVSNNGICSLKPDVKPKCYRINTTKFNTIEELFMYMDFYYSSDTKFFVNGNNDEADIIVNTWNEYQKKSTQSNQDESLE